MATFTSMQPKRNKYTIMAFCSCYHFGYKSLLQASYSSLCGIITKTKRICFTSNTFNNNCCSVYFIGEKKKGHINDVLVERKNALGGYILLARWKKSFSKNPYFTIQFYRLQTWLLQRPWYYDTIRVARFSLPRVCPPVIKWPLKLVIILSTKSHWSFHNELPWYNNRNDFLEINYIALFWVQPLSNIFTASI